MASIKIDAILEAINNTVLHVCMAMFFAFCGFTHYMAVLNMEISKRQFAVMNDKTFWAMALIDWVAAHWWLAIAYVLLVVGSVAFLQFRGRPWWTSWLIAVILCIPCVVYWKACVYIVFKVLRGLA